MKPTRWLWPWVFYGLAIFHAAAYSAEVSNVDVRSIKITSADRLDAFVSFRTPSDEPTIQLSPGKLSVKIDDVLVPASELKTKSFADSEQGLAVLIALDLSGSMARSLPTLKQELKKYIHRLRPGKDFVAIGIIGDNWKLLLDFTSDIEEASSFIDQLQGASQTTALFESIYDGVRLLSHKGSDIPVRRSMIVLSDGMNEKAGRTAAQCIDIAKQSFIDVNSLIFLPTQNAKVLAAKGELEVISKDTGGVTFTALTAEQIGEGVDKLSQEMANEVVLSMPARFIPTTGLTHTLGINYDNFSKRHPFEISENELSRIKAIPAPKASFLQEKLWIYLALGAAALCIIVFLIWRLVADKREAERLKKEAASAIKPVDLVEKMDANQQGIPDSSPAPVDNVGGADQTYAPKPPARKTEYRAPASNLSVTQLVLIRGGISEQTFPLNGNQISIGANDDNDICLDIPSVSGRHAVLTRTASGYAIADLNSTNGTYINGTRIHQGAVNLQPGQELRLGVAVLRAE
jgi:hypothetical protein